MDQMQLFETNSSSKFICKTQVKFSKNNKSFVKFLEWIGHTV